ncbi:MAG: hypothetical protein K0S58_123 [Nitrospira sp.]|jgi:hypothetical protein|nr:hypothetical protein [Nitrospira sp.]
MAAAGCYAAQERSDWVTRYWRIYLGRAGIREVIIGQEEGFYANGAQCSIKVGRPTWGVG